MSEELKPARCGCGGEAKVSTWTGTMATTINDCNVVYCEACGTQTKRFKTETEAITAWNRAMGAYQFRDLTKKIERTVKVNVHYRDESVVFGFCECGQAVNTYSTYCPNCGARLEWE